MTDRLSDFQVQGLTIQQTLHPHPQALLRPMHAMHGSEGNSQRS
jgi:hypothetical protein